MDDDIYDLVSYSTDLDDDAEFITLQVDWDGRPTSACVVFPVDAAPAIAHAVLDQWNEAMNLMEDDE